VIEDAVPQIVELLQDSNSNVQSTGANALGKLAEQGK
jgi:HEAT repeat protein